MLTNITFSNFEATCVASIVAHDQSTVLLEMLGSHAAVSAIWAKLSGVERTNKKYKHTGEVRIGDDTLTLAEGIHYKTFRRELPNKLVNLLLVHPSISGKSQIEPHYVLCEDDGHPASFWSKLNYAVKLPFKREWESELWDIGREGLLAPYTRLVWNTQKGMPVPETSQVMQKPITPLNTRFGQLYCYEIDPSEEVWLAIIQQLRLQ